MSTTIQLDFESLSTDELHLLLDVLEDDVEQGSTDSNVESDIELLKDEILKRASA